MGVEGVEVEGETIPSGCLLAKGSQSRLEPSGSAGFLWAVGQANFNLIANTQHLIPNEVRDLLRGHRESVE
jgi:hypothetical protein